MIEAEDIRTLFGDLLERIGDTDLRDRVVESWVIACREGGWEEIEAVRRMPFTLLTDCGNIGFVEHTVAVTLGAIGLAEAQEQAYAAMPYSIDVSRGSLHELRTVPDASSRTASDASPSTRRSAASTAKTCASIAPIPRRLRASSSIRLAKCPDPWPQ